MCALTYEKSSLIFLMACPQKHSGRAFEDFKRLLLVRTLWALNPLKHKLLYQK